MLQTVDPTRLNSVPAATRYISVFHVLRRNTVIENE